MSPSLVNEAPARATLTGAAALLSVLAIASTLYCNAIAGLPITTKGEAREAIVVQAMVRDTDYVLPMRNGNEMPSKPPLFHWIGALVSPLFGGVTPAAVRIASVLSALVVLLLTVIHAWRAWGTAAAVAAGVALLSMQQVMASATTARVDMLLAACVVTATISGANAVARGTRFSPIYFAASALAVLAKGPVGYVLPAVTVICYCAAARRRPSLEQLNLRVGLPLLALPLIWYAAAWASGGRAFLDTFLLKENYYRIVDPDAVAAGHVRPFWYYPPALIGAAAPWSPLLIPALARAWSRRDRLDADSILFPLVWLATTIVLFSFAGSKRAVYLLPCFPAIALLIGEWLATRARVSVPQPPPSRPALVVIAATVAVGALAVVLIVAQSLGLNTFSWFTPFVGKGSDRSNLAALAVIATAHRARLLGWGAIALSLIALAATSAGTRRWWNLFYSIAAFVLVTVTVAGLPMYRAMAARQSVEAFAGALRDRIPDDEPLHFYHGFDYSVTYYLNRPIPAAPDAGSAVGRNRAWFFVWESSLDELRAEAAALDDGIGNAHLEIRARFDYHGNPQRDTLVLAAIERGDRSKHRPAAQRRRKRQR